MSEPYFSPDAFKIIQGHEQLNKYQFGDHMVNHYFCPTCGIHTFHEAVDKPDHYRVNLGCIEKINLPLLSVRNIDGASF